MTKVWVNDVLVGEADSLNTPYQYNLTKYITEKNFHLTILVSNVDYSTKGGHLTSPDTQTNWNGIIGEIALHIYEPVYISGIWVFPDIEKKEATLELTTVNTTDTEKTLPLHISAELMDVHGTTGKNAPEAEVSVTFKVGTAKTTVTYVLGEDAVLWSEYSPVIYQLTVAISKTKEKAVTTFGLRKFSTNETEFLINGTSTFLRGKHDVLIFLLTGAVPTTVEEWIRVMKISKSYGINHYRFHTCCPPDAAFVAADLLGIYMEPQLPFWGTITTLEDENHNEAEQQYLIAEGYRMMETFGNHASYCMMSLGNELWGSKEKLSQILSDYKAVDRRHLYTQGSNNFQHTPVILPEEDFFVGVRFSKNRLFRGSYGMSDQADLAIRYYQPKALVGQNLHWTLTWQEEVFAERSVAIPDNTHGLQKLGAMKVTLPDRGKAYTCKLTLSVDGSTMKNTYELYVYPQDNVQNLSVPTIGEGEHQVCRTKDFYEAKELLAQGKHVLYLPEEVAESLEGFYCTDFWCYPMFRDICNWMKKPVAVGTMGLLIQKNHPALREFQSHKYATPQWYHTVIVQS